MRVSEIFYSLSGEGIHVGIPTVFIRLAGCNLAMQGSSCNYCDTSRAWNLSDGEEMNVSQVLKRMEELKANADWALISGGEPLLQGDDVRDLMNAIPLHYEIEVETSGSIEPPKWFSEVSCWSVDVKCPSSGPAYGSFQARWISKLRGRDQLKFVVSTQKDLDFVRVFLEGPKLRPAILISPITGILLNKEQSTVEEYWNRDWLKECADFCKEHNARLSLQLHKILYGDRRGV